MFKKIALAAFFFLAALTEPTHAQSATSTTVFPPSNITAGGGLLYFPEGGKSSLFAAPVLADERVITALAGIEAAIGRLQASIESVGATTAASLSALSNASATATATGSTGTITTTGSSLVPYPTTLACSRGDGNTKSPIARFGGLSNGVYRYSVYENGTRISSPNCLSYDAKSGRLINNACTFQCYTSSGNGTPVYSCPYTCPTQL